MTLLIILVILAILLITVVGIYKFNHGLYNGLDLAIYANVLWNSGNDAFMWSSIQQTHYFGDHVELWLIPLTLIYSLWSSPVVLIVLQALWLFGSTFIFFSICTKLFSTRSSFWFSVLFLCNPFLWNAALFEFHMVTLAVPIVLLLWLFYLQKKLVPFLLTGVCALLVREDIAFVVIGFGILSLLDKRSRSWWMTPIVGGLFWFVIAMIIARWVGAAPYKFTTYYSWLWESDLPTLAAGIFSLQNLLLVAGVAVPFFFLPFFSLKYLLPGFGIFAQLLLSRFDASIVLQTHYPIVLVPLCATAGCLVLAYSRNTFIRLLHTKTHRALLIIIIGVVTVGVFIGMTAAVDAFNFLAHRKQPTVHIHPRAIENDSVIAGYGVLPLLAHTNLYTLHYAVPGKKQFSEEPYLIGANPEYAVVDLRDFTFLELALQSSRVPGTRAMHAQQLRSLLNGYDLSTKTWPIFELTHRTSDGFADMLSQLDVPPPVSSPTPLGPLTLDAWEYNRSILTPSFTLYFTPIDLTPDAWYQITLQQEEHTYTAPLAWNLFTPEEVMRSVNVTMTIPLPFELDIHAPIRISLATRTGKMELSGLKSLEPYFLLTPLAETMVTISSRTANTDVDPE